MYKKRRLHMISGLMVASLLLLLVVIGSWLSKQYGEEKVFLKKDLARIYTSTQRKLIDSMITRKILTPLALSSSRYRKGISMELTSTDTTTVTSINGAKDSVDHTSNFKMVYYNGKDTVTPPMTDQLSFVLRAITQRLDDSAFFSVDTSLLKHNFDRALAKNKYRMTSTWENDTDNKSRLIISSEENSGFAKDIYIYTYAAFLVSRIIPQIIFSLLLLLCCSLAFILSYRTARQQISLNLQKDDLISNISHELKTPVATAKVALEAFNHFNALDNPRKTKDYLEMATTEMNRLEQLINSILNSMQLEQGQFALEKQWYTPEELISPLTRQLQPEWATAGITCTFDTGAVQGYILGDKLHLQGAFYNLLDNAVRYGGTAIQITLQQQRRAIVIIIADNGPGIPDEYQEKVFDKFFRIPSGNLHNVKGHGLGLNYTRSIIRQHGGHISVNNNPGGGARFRILLPIHPNPAV